MNVLGLISQLIIIETLRLTSGFKNPQEVFLRRGRRWESRTSITIIVFDFLYLYLLLIQLLIYACV